MRNRISRAKPHHYEKGMPRYVEGGYKPEVPGSFYVLTSGDYVKIGITNRKVSTRCSEISRASGLEFKEVYSRRDTDGSIPLEIESRLLKRLREKHVAPLEKFAGHTECFKGLDIDSVIEEANYLSYELNLQ